MIFDIIQGVKKARSRNVSVVDIVNFYPEIYPDGIAKVLKALIGCPGYRTAVTMYATGACRGLFVTASGRLFGVVGNRLIEVDTNETATERGQLNTSSGMCGFAENGLEIVIVDGTDGYTYTLATDTIAEITSGGFPSNPTHVIFTDGYFIVNEGASGRFYYSDNYDGSTWQALNYATAEYSPDPLQGIVKTSVGTIWMIGSSSVELWQNIGAVNLPWRRIPGSQKEIGCIAPYSIATNGTHVFFLGGGQQGYGGVYMGSGYDLQRISTPSIENEIKGYAVINTATSFVYSDEGHIFYVVSFGTEATLVYDVTTGLWHHRGTYNSESGLNIRQKANGYAFFNGKHYVGSYLDGVLSEMNLSTYSENDETIKRVIVTGSINNENKRLFHRRLELDLEKGIGPESGDVPHIMMQYSNDGGNTWSSELWTEAAKTAGAIGEYDVRAFWPRIGSARDRRYTFTFSDSVKWIILNAYTEVS